jgi:uncharacterized membrane protein
VLKVSSIVIGVGIIVIVFGMIFQFQGRGNLGPESSFMYHNKDWINYGLYIAYVGIALCAIGSALYVRSKMHSKIQS